MKKSVDNNRKKKTAGISAFLLALLLLLGGTFAWYTFASELNEFEHEPYGALLHDDYKEARGDDRVSNKEIYVENTGEVDLSVRVQLKEYMEIEGTSLIAGKTKADQKNWSVHRHNPNTGTLEDCEAVFHDYWEWKLGGDSILYEKGKMFQSGTKYRYDEEGKDSLQTAVNTGYTNGGRSSGVITIEEYMVDYFYQEKPYEGWILDSEDGYAYWSDYLEPGETTGLLLDKVMLKDEINNRYYYGIEVEMEAVDDADMLSWLETDRPTTDGRETDEASEEAKKFLHRRYYGPLVSIEVQKEPEKMEYVYGEAFNPEEMVLLLIYETGRTKELRYSAGSGITWEPTTELGTPGIAAEQESIEITIWYEGKKDTIDVIIHNPIETVAIGGTLEITEYEHGEELIPKGLTVTAIRKSGYIELEEADADTEGLDWELPILENDTPTTLTDQSAEVRVTYKEVTESTTLTGLTITNPLREIEIEKEPVNRQIWGELFGPTGMILKRIFKSGVSDSLEYSDTAGITWDIEVPLGTAGLDADEEEQELVISYGGKETPLSINVYNPVHEVIISGDVKYKEYEHNNKLINTGLKVTAKRKSGTIEMNEAEADTPGLDWNLPTLQNNTVATLTNQSEGVSVTYKGVTGNKTVSGLTITNPLKGIGISKGPNKTSYTWGTPFEPAGLILSRTYKSGISDTLAYSSAPDKISWIPKEGLNLSNASLATGTLTIAISYEGYPASVNVTVNNPVKEVAITGTLKTTTYVTGVPLSNEGLSVTAKRESGYSFTPAANEVTWNLPTMKNEAQTEAKNQTANVTATYGGKTSAVKTFEGLTVTNPLQSIAITTQPTKRTYAVGESFDKAGMIVKGNYTAGGPYTISGWSYSPTTAFTTAGTQTITVSYPGVVSVTMTVTVIKTEEQEAIESINDKNIFDEVTIGDNTWIILSKDSATGQAELLSKRSLGNKSYDSTNNNNWGMCTLRNYLRGDYFESLSTELQKRILTVPKVTEERDSGHISRDETVYLLSTGEYISYRTAYSSAGKGELGSGAGEFWTRSPVTYSEAVKARAYYIDSSGSYTATEVGYGKGVRPALTVRYK